MDYITPTYASPLKGEEVPAAPATRSVSSFLGGEGRLKREKNF